MREENGTEKGKNVDALQQLKKKDAEPGVGVSRRFKLMGIVFITVTILISSYFRPRPDHFVWSFILVSISLWKGRFLRGVPR